jgi:hypothetical protein
LLNVNFVGQLTQITAPLLGYIADRYGAHILVYMMAVSCITGLLLIIVAAENETEGVDLLLYPAFGLLGLTTWMGSLLTVTTGLYFASDIKTQSRVIFVLNALFDAGSVTYLGLWAIGEWFGASLTVIIAGYTVTAVLVFGGAVYFWSVAVPDTQTCSHSHPEEETEKEEHESVFVRKYDECATIESSVVVPTTASDDGSGSGEVAAQLESGDSHPGTRQFGNDEHENDPEIKTGTVIMVATATDHKEHPDSKVVDSEPSLNEDDVDAGTDTTIDMMKKKKKNTAVSDDPLRGEKEYIIVADRRSRQQLTSGPYLLLVVFFSFHLTANQWNLSTQRDFLAHLGDDEQDNKYLTIFTLLMPASIVGLPFVDAAITHYGFAGGLQSINLLALAYNVIKVRTQLTNDSG